MSFISSFYLNYRADNKTSDLDPYVYRCMRGATDYLQQSAERQTFHTWIDEWLFLHATLPCYKSPSLKERSISLVIKGWVGKDGMGDWYHIKNAAERVLQIYPNWKVEKVIEIECLEKHRRRENFPKNDPNLYLFGTMSESQRLESEEQVPALEKARVVVRRADLVIDMPHGDSPCMIHRDGTLRIVEYGHRFRPFPPGIPMGVGAFEFGLFFPQKKIKASLFELEDAQLREFLTAGFESKSLYFAYNHQTAKDYFMTCCVAAQQSKAAFVDILFPVPFSFPYDFRRLPNSSEKLVTFLKKWGVKEIQFYSKRSEKGIIEDVRVEIQNEGIIVRALDPFPLSNSDMQILMAHAQTTGCTGDLSLTEALNAGSLIDYEIRKHKTSFYDSLIQLAEEFFQGEATPYFVDYLKAVKARDERNFETIEAVGILAARQETQEHARLFYGFLHRYYDFDPVFFDLIRRKLLLKEHPDLAKQEEELLAKFKTKQIDLIGARNALSQSIHALFPHSPRPPLPEFQSPFIQALYQDPKKIKESPPTGSLQLSKNAIQDIYDWIQKGECVVLHSDFENGHIYHQCSQPSIKDPKVIYIDVNPKTNLLLDDEWPYLLQENGCTACSCSLNENIQEAKPLPNTHHFKYGYSK